MLMELTFSLDQSARDALLERYAKRVVGGIGSDGERFEGTDPIQLIDWVPPEDWWRRVLSEAVTDGIGITSPCFGQTNRSISISDEIREAVEENRRKFPWSCESEVPASVLILACIKNHCPLPPYFWRATLLPSAEGMSEGAARG